MLDEVGDRFGSVQDEVGPQASGGDVAFVGTAALFEVAAQDVAGVEAFVELTEGFAGDPDVGGRIHVCAPAGPFVDMEGEREGAVPSPVTGRGWPKGARAR